MNKKIIKNIMFYKRLAKIVITKKTMKLMLINQLLLVSTPVIVSAHTITIDNSNQETINKINEFANNTKSIIDEQLMKERNNYINKIADFYGVNPEVIEDTIMDIASENSENLSYSSDLSIVIFDEVDKKIADENIPVEQNVNYQFATTEVNKITETKNSPVGAIYKKYGEMYGIDPDLLMARDMQESNLEHNSFDPEGAYGISQIESELFNTTVQVHNYKTKKDENIMITEKGARNLDTNIQYGAIKMQQRIRTSNNNIFIALQTYNYGSPAMNAIVSKYSEDSKRSVEEIKADKNNFDSLKYYIDDLHYNPNKYINSSYSIYGDNDYISRIMRYISDGTVTIKDENGNDIICNLKTNKSLNVDEYKLTTYILNPSTTITK